MLTYGSDENSLNNEERKHTIAMMMPSNGHVYVALNRRSFNEYICDWLGLVHDCYILRTCSIDESLSWFRHGLCNVIVNESDNESGFGGTAEKIMNEAHCFITEEEQVSLYSCSNNEL